MFNVVTQSNAVISDYYDYAIKSLESGNIKFYKIFQTCHFLDKHTKTVLLNTVFHIYNAFHLTVHCITFSFYMPSVFLTVALTRLANYKQL